MTKLEELKRLYEANLACGDLGEAQEARFLAMIAAAEVPPQRERAAA